MRLLHVSLVWDNLSLTFSSLNTLYLFSNLQPPIHPLPPSMPPVFYCPLCFFFGKGVRRLQVLYSFSMHHTFWLRILLTQFPILYTPPCLKPSTPSIPFSIFILPVLLSTFLQGIHSPMTSFSFMYSRLNIQHFYFNSMSYCDGLCKCVCMFLKGIGKNKITTLTIDLPVFGGQFPPSLILNEC